MPSTEELLSALHEDDIDELDRLICAGGNMNAVDDGSNLTLLGIAIQTGKFECQAYLELAGANPTAELPKSPRRSTHLFSLSSPRRAQSAIGANGAFDESTISLSEYASPPPPPPPDFEFESRYSGRWDESPYTARREMDMVNSTNTASSQLQPLASHRSARPSTARQSESTRRLAQNQAQIANRANASKITSLEKGIRNEKKALSRLEETVTNEKKALKNLTFQVKKSTLQEKKVLASIEEVRKENEAQGRQLKAHENRIIDCEALLGNIGKLLEVEQRERTATEASLLSDVEWIKREADALREGMQTAIQRYDELASKDNAFGGQFQNMGDQIRSMNVQIKSMGGVCTAAFLLHLFLGSMFLYFLSTRLRTESREQRPSTESPSPVFHR